MGRQFVSFPCGILCRRARWSHEAWTSGYKSLHLSECLCCGKFWVEFERGSKILLCALKIVFGTINIGPVDEGLCEFGSRSIAALKSASALSRSLFAENAKPRLL